jgi:hypothetical protein
MEETFSRAENLAADLKAYAENRIAALKLSAAEKSSGLLAGLLAKSLVLILFLFFLIFAGIGLALVIAKLTGEYYWGFLLVAVLYLLLAFLCWINRERLLRIPLMNAMLHQIFKEETGDEEN